MAAWSAYLDRWITGIASHKDYLAKLGADRIAKLVNAIHA
jgi:pantothenate kinase type III